MKRLLLPLILMLPATACSAETIENQSAKPIRTQEYKEENTMTQNPNRQSVRLLVNGQTFDITLEENPTAQAFVQLLPLDLSMQDHLNNEKYAALPKALPADDKRAGRIEAGDVMLFQGNTLVVFYESFDSSYRYTKIGKIKNPNALKQALGKNDVQVKWHME